MRFIEWLRSTAYALGMNQPTCLITGGSRGIGLAAARRFAESGYNLCLVARHAAELAEAAEQLHAIQSVHGTTCHTFSVDLSQREQATRIIDEAVQATGRLDVLVNNAGYAPLAPVERTSDEQFDACLAVNVAATFATVRAAWPIFKRQGGGVIVNVSSLAATDPFMGFSIYGASKAWVSLFTKAIAREGKSLNIRAFAIAPGAVETRMLRENFKSFPAERTLAPEDVAALIAACATDAPPCPSGESVAISR